VEWSEEVRSEAREMRNGEEKRRGEEKKERSEV
jgi:hypothetical protein